MWHASDFLEPDWRFRTTLLFFSQGVLVLGEAAWSRLTGRRVGGWIGRLWTVGSLLVWASLLFDTWYVLQRCPNLGLLFSTNRMMVFVRCARGLADGQPSPIEFSIARYLVPFGPMLPRGMLTV
jgi:hypothetical protein